MPKTQPLDPSVLRKPGTLSFTDIPLNAYQKGVKDVKDEFTAQELTRIYADMTLIREFENMLNLIKTQGEYNGIKYNHPGPAHLSMGQEASAVGQAFALDPRDMIFGSHRSHGEILAKGLSAVYRLPVDELQTIMEGYHGGELLRAVGGMGADVRETAVRFLFLGALAEIFARKIGFNRGLGGSMHAFFTPFGIYPNNALVGGSADIATGAALYKRVNRKGGIVVANIGDASMGCGPVYEAMNFAAMDQLRELWDKAHSGGLPVLFNFFNNQYGMGGQTAGETMAYGILARMGAGVASNQMHAERVDGYNPLAVIDAVRRKRALLEKGEGPVLLDVLTYRYAGHSPSDSSSYRTPEEVALWQACDPIEVFGAQLIEAGLADARALASMGEYARETVTRALSLACDPAVSPYMDLASEPNAISKLMFSNGHAPALSDDAPELSQPLAENPRVQTIARRERFALDANGKPFAKAKQYQFRDGVFEAMAEAFATDPTMITYGEDVRDWGGAFAVYRGLTELLPYHRLFNAPISEAAIVGTGVGYALAGGRAVVELMYCDFMGRAGDQIINQMPKWQAMSAGELKMPLVLRVSVGSKYGAQHSQDLTSLFAHIPGLKVAFPATPYDAKGLMASALAGTDPVVFFESQRLYDIGELFHEGGVPAEHYEIPFGLPDVKREGKDVTILTVGAMLYRALEAADILMEKHGLSAEIIDARSLVPFDYEPVIESVKKTGRLIVTGDACERGSFLNDFARNLTELCFDDLDAPPIVVGARNWITPAYELEDAFFPQASWLLDAMDAWILPLKGHVRATNANRVERLRVLKEGV